VVALLGDGRITHLPGGVEEYLRRRAADQSAPAAGSAAATAATAAKTTTPADVRATNGGPAKDPAQQRLLRKDLQRLERRLESLQRKESELHKRLEGVGGDYAAAAELSSALKVISAEVEQIETEWLSAAEDLENS
jgi:ATP-binding cassette subfamily F protein uup